MTKYPHTFVCAVPENLIDQANHLALIIGENSDDILTLSEANYEDSKGKKYAVCCFKGKPSILAICDTATLPETPPQGLSVADRAKAQVILNLIGQPNGVFLETDKAPDQAFLDMGLSRIETSI